MSLSVIHSNNMAVAAMAQGKYAEAYDMLRMVLSELKHLQEDAEPQQGKVRILDHQYSCAEISSVILPSSLSCSAATSGDDCPFEVYNRALVVQLIGGSMAPTSYDEDDDPMQDITATTSNYNDQRQTVRGKVGLCVLYNMGLCFQLLSNHEVALKFYQSVLEMADTVQVEQEVDCEEDYEDDALLAVLASLHNMTCIHILACDYSRAAVGHKMLLDCLSTVDTVICLSEEDGFFFEMMGFFHPTWKLSTAPAA